jgi:hypothetical protein
MSAKSKGNIKTKFRFQRIGAGELASSARMFLPPCGYSIQVCTAGRRPAYYLPIAQQIIYLLFATFFSTEESSQSQESEDDENSGDSQQHVTPR